MHLVNKGVDTMSQKTNAFATWMLATYEHNELADICNHGCASCAPDGMVYYTENVALFEQYRDALFEIMADYQEAIDAPDSLPEYVCKNSATYELFCNSVVWFCAESVALYATDGAYSEGAE